MLLVRLHKFTLALTFHAFRFCNQNAQTVVHHVTDNDFHDRDVGQNVIRFQQCIPCLPDDFSTQEVITGQRKSVRSKRRTSTETFVADGLARTDGHSGATDAMFEAWSVFVVVPVSDNSVSVIRYGNSKETGPDALVVSGLAVFVCALITADALVLARLARCVWIVVVVMAYTLVILCPALPRARIANASVSPCLTLIWSPVARTWCIKHPLETLVRMTLMVIFPWSLVTRIGATHE